MVMMTKMMGRVIVVMVKMIELKLYRISVMRNALLLLLLLVHTICIFIYIYILLIIVIRLGSVMMMVMMMIDSIGTDGRVVLYYYNYKFHRISMFTELVHQHWEHRKHYLIYLCNIYIYIYAYIWYYYITYTYTNWMLNLYIWR